LQVKQRTDVGDAEQDDGGPPGRYGSGGADSALHGGADSALHGGARLQPSDHPDSFHLLVFAFIYWLYNSVKYGCTS
jgi:hypothetical protein